MGEPESEAPQAQQESPSGPANRRDTATSVASSIGSKGSMSKSKSKRNSMRRRSSGLFAAARASFYRSRGQSGASVETLRGNTGADFEGYATVHRGDDDGAFAMFDLTSLFCGCCKQKDGLYFLLVKGYHCFVFKDEESKSPKYAIELMNTKAVVQPSHVSFVPRVPHPGAAHDTTYTTIHLETGLGDVEYKFTFANMDDGLATKFCNAVSAASNEATTEQVRKRLGHEQLLNKRSSVRYANTIGAAKTKEQPDAPVGAGEMLAGMPSPQGY
mmetsp:Transcript_15179/g.25946  ORF Transcript_15179/g.25946 Transcript_15179/m.25946 type:complete len:272 (+) Transcript_15179:216-1031(+)|eukprot:CAMPEP_0183738012 /NCGR_PEP_ID=MMETSP0737-20130205/53657_1 /TAXON_ID=385413 /ORGANISM="Thalassiosira miniscula, Strain CCMP1093" /LENGTH=271 /DNA_ID=CAMNT_0025972455 /DNA_START=376 /DNA_END=1191 /DNA_ORIENTATION=+